MKCIVPNCCSESSRSARSEGITFHKFPTDQETLTVWQKSLGITSYNASEDNVICSEHFHERDFCTTNYGLRKLHQDAVPVNLNPETPVAEKVCRVCFVMDSKMRNLQTYCKQFEDVTGIPSEVGDGRLPQHICWECAAQLATAANFRAKALLSDGLLRDLLNRDNDLKFCYLKPMRRVLKEYGFGSKFKQETFDIEHIDTDILDSCDDTKPTQHNEQNCLENDLHEIIDESVIKNDDNDDVVDENVTVTNDSNDIEYNNSDNDVKINTLEIEELDETEFLDMNEYTSNMGKEINYGIKKNIHDTVDDKNPNRNAEFYMEIQGFKDNDENNGQSNQHPEISQHPQVTAIEFKYASNISQPSSIEDSVPFKGSDKTRPFPTIDISQFQPVLKRLTKSPDHVEKTVPTKKGKVKKAPTIDFRYARNLLKRLGHIKDPPPAKKSKKNVTEDKPTRKRKLKRKPIVESFEVKQGDITVYHIRNTSDCEIPADVSELESHFKITPLTQDRLLQEIESRKDKAAYALASYKCAECYLTFPDEDRYNTHMTTHDKRFGLHQCGICKIFKNAAHHLRRHMKYSHSFEFECNKCSWKTRNMVIARSHIKFHEGDTHACPHCSKTFGSKTSYFSHMRLNHICDVVCDICGYAYVSNAGLHFHKKKAHKLLVLNLPPFEGPHCDTCDIKFLSQAAYDTHLKCSSKHLQSEDDPARIRNDRASQSLNNRVKRLRNTGPSYAITCEQCGEDCETFRAYRAHFSKFHSGIAPTKKRYQQRFMCDQCGKYFLNNCYLRAHQWVHTGQKLFQCDVCKKSFSQKMNLTRHIEIRHMNITRKYTCELCGRSFCGSSSNLTRHMRQTHAVDGRRYKCLQCDRAFVFPSELNLHVEYMHNKKPYPKKKNPRKKPVNSEEKESKKKK